MIINSDNVRLGKNYLVEESAIVGYKPTREIDDLMLYLGDNIYIRSNTVIYLGSHIGNKIETGHNVIIREENKLGNNVSIWSNSIIDYNCIVGNNVKIHSGCYIAQLSVIEDDVFLAPGVMFANEKYPTGIFDEEYIKGPRIKKGVKIGIGSIVLPNIVIGENSIIGAGSVVTKDIDDNTVAYGVPARQIKQVSELNK